MNDITVLEGRFDDVDGRYALVVARFNSFVVEALLEGAIDALVRHGVSRSNLQIIRVPGAWELPVAAKRLADKNEHDAIITLGAVIRGGTAHFEYVAGEAAKGIAAIQNTTGIPVAFGVLTVDTIEHAIVRSGTKAGNKGEEAALSAIEMVSLLKQIYMSITITAHTARRKARRFALQALYQWQMTGDLPGTIEQQFLAENDMSKVDLVHFNELLHKVPARVQELDALLSPELDRSVQSLSQVERVVLRMGVYELVARIDVPYRVVINECIELVKAFGADESFKYINGVLDKVAR